MVAFFCSWNFYDLSICSILRGHMSETIKIFGQRILKNQQRKTSVAVILDKANVSENFLYD